MSSKKSDVKVKLEKENLASQNSSDNSDKDDKKKVKKSKLSKEEKAKKKAERKTKRLETSQARKKNRSIIVSLSVERILTGFFGMLCIDITYVTLMLAGFCYNAQMTANPSFMTLENNWLDADENAATILDLMRSIQYHIIGADGKAEVVSAGYIGEFIYATLFVIIIIELLTLLFTCIFTPIKMHRKLKPLTTMTEATRALKNVDLTSGEFTSLQDAINNLSPNKPDQKLHTGKKEFVGMEDAINDLLERTRNSYKSQIRFVSDASHELRTPIAVIQGYANMLDRWGREDKEILDESVKSIKSEAENMNRLVENLLFLARGDSGRTVLRLENISINQILCDIYDEFVMIDSDHEFSLDLRADITAQADASLIKQCLRILVDNAIKYSPKGTNIILRLKSRGEAFYCVEVQDYGIGVKKNDADKIFERFYRSDPARNRQNGGSGLGLSIAKWIADKHNGYFELLSYEELGTRISLVLPVKVSEKNEENSEK